MTKNHKYPTNYELREIFSHIANRKFLVDFAQGRGIFITYASQDYLAKELSNIFYEDTDLEMIRAEAYKDSSSHNLSGFVLTSKNKRFNLKITYESLREHGHLGEGIVGNQLLKMPEGDFFNYKGSIEYVKKKPGRIEFLQDEHNSFDFYLKDLKDGNWQIEIDCGKSTDAKILREILSKNLPMEDHQIELIDQDMLSNEKTIMFFDELVHAGMNSDWLFLDVKHLTVKRGRDETDEDEDDISDENEDSDVDSTIKEFSKEELSGITQAILQGKNLRDDDFVKQCEAKGYRFTAMTYEFEHTSQPFIIAVRAEFKGRPKVFEVGISDVQEKTGLGANRRQSSLVTSLNRQIRSTFWNNAKTTFKLVMSKPISSKESSGSHAIKLPEPPVDTAKKVTKPIKKKSNKPKTS